MAHRTLDSDSGAGADQNPLTTGWTTPALAGTTAMQRLGNGFTGSVHNSLNAAYRSGTTPPADQWAAVRLATIFDGDCGVLLRGSANGWYNFAGRTVANGGLLLERIDSGGSTQIAANALAGGRGGDWLYAEILGDGNLYCAINGSPVLTGSDPAAGGGLATGSYGITAFNEFILLDSWYGGDFFDVASTRVARAFRDKLRGRAI